MENIKDYCPSSEDSICEKFKTELKDKNIECNNVLASRLKKYLEWKCENQLKLQKNEKYQGMIRSNSLQQHTLVYPENYLLPTHIRPESYEIWLWIMKEPIIKGNVTILVTVTR